MLKLAFAVLVGDWESVTVIVKFDAPAAVGVPEITPVAAFRDKPAGNAPVIDQV
jgi:hypothetical protein